MNKKGFTLIEVMVSIMVMALVSLIIINSILKLSNDYLEGSDKSIYFDNIDNCFINLDNLFKSSYINSIFIEENKVILLIGVGHESISMVRKEVSLERDVLLLKTYNDIDSVLPSGTNVLLKNISKFTVVKKDKLVYFTIESMKGDKFTRCI